ncbi:MAG: prephenate dehydrogenase, partial [Methanobacterium sp.]|nr:prephenate dehydrogenase [Methanobacterium sp.]
NLPLKTFDVSVVLPESSQPEIISCTINSLEGVVESEVKDVYQGEQIQKGFKSITFSYQVISTTSNKKVEELLVGFGGIIR